MTSGRLTFALIALLALAGCTAPVGDAPVGQEVDAPSDAPSVDDSDDDTDGPAADAGDPPTDSVVVREGSLDVDANATFQRTQSLLDAEFAGTTVVVRDLSAYKSADVSDVAFFRLFGVSNPRLDAERPAGLTTVSGAVYVSPASAAPPRVEQVLAHEFVHVAQVRENMVPWFGGFSLGRVSLDEQLARSALVEGGAVYIADAYTRAHLPDTTLQSTYIDSRYANGTSGNRLSLGAYHFGARYVNATIDDPSELASVYEDPPRTTEAVLHPGTSDDTAALDITVETENYRRATDRTGRVGEFVTRVVLRDLVSKERAVAASEGWGNDRVVLFESDDSAASWVDRSAAWVTRWDSPTDADEFASVARNASWTDNAGYEHRVERVDDRTIVVFAGGEQFVRSATVSGNVTIAA